MTTVSTSGRRWHGAVLAVALACVACGALAADVPPPQPAGPGPRWGHELLQVDPDPAVRFGRLPNGLRYALQHNETPADGVATPAHIQALFRDHIARRPPIEVQARAASPPSTATPSVP